MVKNRPGSRKGMTKMTTSGYRVAKARAGRLGKRAHQMQHVVHPALRKVWDRNLTPAENLSRVGLCSSVNTVEKKDDSAIRVVALKNVIKLDEGRVKDSNVDMEVVKELEQEAALGERGTKQVVRPGEQVALERMVKKHGSDWVKMSRDTKLNYLQWTPAQLEKRVTRMQRILENKD